MGAPHGGASYLPVRRVWPLTVPASLRVLAFCAPFPFRFLRGRSALPHFLTDVSFFSVKTGTYGVTLQKVKGNVLATVCCHKRNRISFLNKTLISVVWAIFFRKTDR